MENFPTLGSSLLPHPMECFKWLGLYRERLLYLIPTAAAAASCVDDQH